MNNILGWIKSHIAIVICSVVILASLPVAWFFSSGWNTQIRDKQQAAASDKLKSVESAKVTYSLPKLSSDEAGVSVTSAPNQTLTDWFKSHREKILAQAQGIVQEAERINRRGHVPLVDGLFPNAPPQTAQVKALELADKIVYSGNDTSAYPQLLQKIGAGMPPLESDVATLVNEERQKREEAITSGAKRELSAEEKELVLKATVEKRLEEYRARAGEISVYASMDIFPQGSSLGSSVPRTMPDKPPPLDDCFFWQFDYWLASDILDGIALANTDSGGQPTSVDRSVVKRIDRIETSDNWVNIFSSGGGGGEDSESAGPADAGSPDALITPKFEKSITGRWSGPGNAVYDVRNVSISVVVSSARLPELINAMARTNFMTVTGLELSEVDVWSDLEQGFFYGSEHVVRAKLVVETVWLRSWTVPIMPYKVRGYIGLPTEEPKSESESADAAAPAEGETPPEDTEPR